jgi:HEPN domain-containing protein
MDPRLELAHLLLRKASDDLVMARSLAGDPATPDWGIGFHVEQAVEKAIKAVLSSRGIEYPRTHNVSLLLDLLADSSLHIPLERERLILLTPYGVLFRYDEAGPTDAELAQLPNRASLLAMADAVVNWANAVIAT